MQVIRMNANALSRISAKAVALIQNENTNLLLFLAFTIRIIWVLYFPVHPVSDYLWYYERALSISGGMGYSVNNIPTAYWPIGYPAFLGAIFYLFNNSILAAQLANVLLDVASIFLIYKIALLLTSSKKIAGLSLLFFSLYLNHIAYCSLLSSEVLFLFLLLLAVYIFISNHNSVKSFVLFGLTIAAAVLVKPIIVLLPLVFLALKFNKKIQYILITYSILLVALIPITVRNYNIYKEVFFVSLNSPVNLFIGNNPYSNGTYRYDENVTGLIGNPTDEFTESKRAGEYAKKYILENPGKSLSLIPKKIYYQYVNDVDGLSSCFVGIPDEYTLQKTILIFLRWVSQLIYMMVVLLFLYKVYLKIRAHSMLKGIRGVCALVLIYFFLMYLPFFGAPRFHYPMMPFVIIKMFGWLNERRVALQQT